MPTRSLEKEQIALLNKMHFHSKNYLNDYESHLYEKLIKSLQLLHETHQKHKDKMHKQHKEAQDRPQPETDRRQEKIERTLRHHTPEQIIRTFVHCWNEGNFELEYVCLSDFFEKGLRRRANMTEYVKDRLEKFKTRDSAGIKEKELFELSSAIIHGDKSTVSSVEHHKNADGEMDIIYRDYYLISGNNGWRILNYVNKKGPGGR